MIAVRNIIAALILTLLWGALVVLVNPRGDFPLNDDWVYAAPVATLLYDGRAELLSYTGPLTYAQAFLGAAATAVFGYSHHVLRAVTLALALLALCTLLWLLRARRVRAPDAVLLCLLLAANPIFFNLSFTFMTDVPALALLLLSCAALVTAYGKKSRVWVAAACTTALASMLVRQTGALFFPAAVFVLLLQRKKQGVLPMLKVAVLFTALAAGVYAWLGFTGQLPQSAGVHNFSDTAQAVQHAALWSVYGLLYLGFSLAPLFLALALKRSKRFFGWGAILCLTAVALGVLFWAVAKGRLFPYTGNIINHFGLGPNTEVLRGAETAMFPVWMWWLATATAAVGAGWVVYFFVRSAWRMTRRLQDAHFALLFVFVLFLFQFGAVLVVDNAFDRYWLPAIALALAFIGMRYGEYFRQKRAVIALGIAALGLYSVVGTQNYLRWNTVRWEEARALTEQGIARERVDAGYEWCGQELYEKSLGIPNPHDRSKPWYINSLCPVNTAEYVISFSSLEGYTTLSQTTYKSWYDTSPELFVVRQ